MTWPYSPLTTYVANSVPAIKAVDLNSIQGVLNTLYTGMGFFGNGSGGAHTVSGTEFLNNDGHYTTLSIPSTTIFNTCGNAVLAQTSITLAAGGTLSGTPNSASSTTGANYGNANGGGPHGSYYGNDLSGSTSVGSSGLITYGRHYGFGGVGGTGGTGGFGVGGTAASISQPSAYTQYPWRYALGTNFGLTSPNLQAFTASVSNRLPMAAVDSIRGGSSGGPGAGDNSTHSGGAGGVGGALVVLIAPTIIIQGVLQSNGGGGGNGQSGGNTGGGGGGGGGAFLFVCQNLTYAPTSVTCSGGSSGTGSGTGTSGSAGAAGNTTPFQVILP